MTTDDKRERLMESVFEQVGDRDIREMLMDGIMVLLLLVSECLLV